MIEHEQKKSIPYPDKEDKINELRDKIKEDYKERKSKVANILEKYKTRGSLPTTERITVLADPISLAERIPFCEDFKGKEGEITEKKKNDYGLKNTFPNVQNI